MFAPSYRAATASQSPLRGLSHPLQRVRALASPSAGASTRIPFSGCEHSHPLQRVRALASPSAGASTRIPFSGCEQGSSRVDAFFNKLLGYVSEDFVHLYCFTNGLKVRCFSTEKE